MQGRSRLRGVRPTAGQKAVQQVQVTGVMPRTLEAIENVMISSFSISPKVGEIYSDEAGEGQVGVGHLTAKSLPNDLQTFLFRRLGCSSWAWL